MGLACLRNGDLSLQGKGGTYGKTEEATVGLERKQELDHMVLLYRRWQKPWAHRAAWDNRTGWS